MNNFLNAQARHFNMAAALLPVPPLLQNGGGQIEASAQTRYDAAMTQLPSSNSDIHVGELYGKPAAPGQTSAIYHVVAVHKLGITLQNMDNPLSQFETTASKLLQSGYVRLSQTPYVNLQQTGKRKSAQQKLKRCPFTLDVFAERADCERPAVTA